MQQQEPGLSGLHGRLELIKHFPGEPLAASDRRQWVGLEALRYREQPPNEAFQPPLTHHSLVLLLRTPKEFELQCDGVNRVVPPRAGSILVVQAGSPARWRWSSHTDSLHVFLEPGLVERSPPKRSNSTPRACRSPRSTAWTCRHFGPRCWR
jgi:hypothetical protein